MSLSATGIDGKGNLRRGVSSATSPVLLRSSGLAPCTPQGCLASSSSYLCPVFPLLCLLCHFQILGGMKVLLSITATQGVSCVRHQLQAGGSSGWDGLCVGLDPTWDECVFPHTCGADPLWMEVGAFGRPQIPLELVLTSIFNSYFWLWYFKLEPR